MKLHRNTHHSAHAVRTLAVVGSAIAMVAATGGAAAGSPTLTSARAQSQAQSRAQSRAHTSTADQAKIRTWHVQAGQQSRDLAIQGMAFLPQNIWIDAGDTIRWTADSAEPHTVTFLATGTTLPPFTEAMDQISEVPTPVPGVVPTYVPGDYYNSAILGTVQDGPPVVSSYSLRFATVGDYTYWCLVHGAVMKGTVHVAAAGTAYPFSQRQYDQSARVAANAIISDGRRLAAKTRRLANSHTVIVGADDGVAMVMRFVRQRVTIHRGETVTFINNGMGAPHTVTFGQEPSMWFSPVNLKDASNYTGGDLSSGGMFPHSTFKVTFNKSGTFNYICALHDYMGMVGTVQVRP